MSLSCDVVMDLVALYQDGLASPNTQKEVTAHLWQCRKCRMQYKRYRRKYYQAVSKKNHMVSQQNMEQNFCMLAKRMRHQKNFDIFGCGVYMVVSCSMCVLVILQKENILNCIKKNTKKYHKNL